MGERRVRVAGAVEDVVAAAVQESLSAAGLSRVWVRVLARGRDVNNLMQFAQLSSLQGLPS